MQVDLTNDTNSLLLLFSSLYSFSPRADIAYNSLHFMASQLTSLDQMIPSPTREITSVVISIQKMMESLKSNMVQTHYDFCYTYFMADVEIVCTQWCAQLYPVLRYINLK